MSSDTSNALNAIGTLIGYIGTEVATDDFFDRLLWPRRAYNGFTWKDVPKMALLMPMGGPLHKAALSTLDDFYKHGLYERHQQGHMLGTAFFRDTKLKYREFGKDPGFTNEYVRNGLWAKAVMKTPFPKPRRQNPVGEENGQALKQPPKVRQKIFVGHLKLFRLDNTHKISKTIYDDANRPTTRTYLALFTTETSAIVCAIVIVVIWRSAFAALWLLPLLLKLISTTFTIHREPLDIPDLKKPGPKSLAKPLEKEEDKLFSVKNPSGGFVVIEGPESLVLPFFRHHGHPSRSKWREILLIAMVVAFTFVFPLGLVCSTLWMSDALQKMWVGYQLYATLAMYVYRYAGGHLWCTTEHQIGKAFLEGDKEGADNPVVLRFKSRHGVAIGAGLERIYCNRYAEAKAAMEALVKRRRPKAISRSPSLAGGSDVRLDTQGTDFSRSSDETLC